MMRLILCLIILMVPSLGAAQGDRRPSHCIAIAQNTPGIEFLHKAAYTDPVSENSVRLQYLDHAMFLLQTNGGVSAVTDFVGRTGLPEFVPDIVTMNHAHNSHWTAAPDERITHVLKGWGVGEPADHHLDLGEMLVRNVTTDIRSPYQDRIEEDGNSIFIFEVAGLCIGHLGHLHHEPDPSQYAAIGRLDVAIVPVDGGLTVDIATMQRIVRQIRASYVIPMHWFSNYSLEQFMVGLGDEFEIERAGGSEVTVSLRSLPSRPTILVLEPMTPPVFYE
ncbi:MBL fold metallo-hydrolase [Alphaproteobacteria bacterium KMM 3653]|uniref:MBL fold metallo-hydrolase n=1 Tax=Harenicola maris TaxID=2841044 RepID=A0AAP2CMU5_9RHOB|nr:MBL fold metallo-hydrolase [Harenicola maris]